TTLIGGAQDELCPPEDLDALAQMLTAVNPDVESYVLQRTGHLLHYERSAAAAALISWRLQSTSVGSILRRIPTESPRADNWARVVFNVATTSVATLSGKNNSARCDCSSTATGPIHGDSAA